MRHSEPLHVFTSSCLHWLRLQPTLTLPNISVATLWRLRAYRFLWQQSIYYTCVTLHACGGLSQKCESSRPFFLFFAHQAKHTAITEQKKRKTPDASPNSRTAIGTPPSKTSHPHHQISFRPWNTSLTDHGNLGIDFFRVTDSSFVAIQLVLRVRPIVFLLWPPPYFYAPLSIATAILIRPAHRHHITKPKLTRKKFYPLINTATDLPSSKDRYRFCIIIKEEKKRLD